MHLLSFNLPTIADSISETRPSWQDSPYICALADDERHFGHVIKTENWHAYDATHSNPSSNDFKYLGEFTELEVAKSMVESAAARKSLMKAWGAGSRPS